MRWRTGDNTGRRVEDQAVRQVGRREFPRGAGYGVGRVDRGRLGVVHEHGWSKWPGTHRVGIRTGQTDRWNSVGSVADTVAVRVGVQGIRTKVAGAVVDARARLRQVRGTVAVVVQVFDQLTVTGIVVGQFIGQTVSVGVFQNLQVEIKGDGRGIGDARNGVGDVRRHFGRRTADDTTDRVDVQSIRQVWRDTPCRTGQLIRWHEAAEQGVVQAVNDAFCCFTKRCGVGTGHTDEGPLSVIHSVGTVANTVVIGVRVKRVGSRVGWSVVDARVRLVHVVKAVTVVIFVFRQRWNARGVAIDGVGLAVAVRVGVSRRVEREGIGAGRAHAANSVGAVAHAIAVRVRIGWICARVRFVGIGHAVSVVVKVLSEPGGIGVGWVVVARKFVGQSVAVAVFQDFNREIPLNGIAVGVVRPYRVGDVGRGFCWRAADFAGVGIHHQSIRQVRCNLVGSARYREVRRNRRDSGVVHGHQGCWLPCTVGVAVWTRNTNACNSVWTVTDSITIGVGIERVGARIAGVNVGSSIRFDAVGKTVAVVVAVSHKTGRWSFSCIVIAWQIIWQSIAIIICKTLQIERECLDCAAIMSCCYRNGRICKRADDRSSDFAC